MSFMETDRFTPFAKTLGLNKKGETFIGVSFFDIFKSKDVEKSTADRLINIEDLTTSLSHLYLHFLSPIAPAK